MDANIDDNPFSNHPPTPPPLQLSTRSEPARALMPGLADTAPKKPSSSIFVEHLEDATPSRDDMEAFDCFSPGSYISSRRQSVELAGYMRHSPRSPTSEGDGAYMLFSHGEPPVHESIYHSPPLSPTSPAHHARNPKAHAHAHSTGMPFAALVRRLSYTSSRLPAKYANRQYRDAANKRPKTSSGPLLFSPVQPLVPDHTPNRTAVELQLGSIQPDNNATLPVTDYSVISQMRPVEATTRPTPRRRTKSGEAVAGSLGKGIARGRVKAYKRPNHPLRSISFMDEVSLKTPSNQKRNKPLNMPSDSATAPVSPVIWAEREQSAVPISTLPSLIPSPEATIGGGQPVGSSMTPDHETEVQLAKHGRKRLSMPNLLAPPLTGQASILSATSHAESVFNESSPLSVNLRTPSPVLLRDGGNVVKVASRRSSMDERREGKPYTPGWPWHRRHSNSSLTSLLSPKLGRQVSPSLLPYSGVPVVSTTSNNSANPTLVATGESSVHLSRVLDRMPSPEMPLHTAIVPQPSTSKLAAEGSAWHANATDAPANERGSTDKAGGTTRRSLSASFIQLGRKVASFGNSQAFESNRQNSQVSSLTSPGEPSNETKTTPVPRRRDTGAIHTPSPRTAGIRSREWPWRSHSHQHVAPQSPSTNSSLSTVSSPPDEAQWSFKVQGVSPAGSPNATLSVPSMNGSTKVSNGLLRERSPVFAKSPLGENSVQTDSYFASSDGPEPSDMVTLSSINADPALQPALAPGIRKPDINTASLEKPDNEEEYLTMRKKKDLLSPDRELSAKRNENSFVVGSRPTLYRNAKSDDGGAAIRSGGLQLTDLDQGMQYVSISAPASGRQSPLMMSGLKSPTRQASPSPSSNLTKIPEADEQDLQTRRESWLASLRGRRADSNRRTSAADIFGLASNSSPQIASPVGPSESRQHGAEPQHAAAFATAMPISAGQQEGLEEISSSGLDFSKKAIQPVSCFDPSLSQLHRPASRPSTPQLESPALRSRAVSQSSLLSASRPATPSVGLSLPSGTTNIRPLPAMAAKPVSVLETHGSSQPKQSHRQTQSLPIVPQLDAAALHISGFGAPESSVLNASQAKFARVLSAAANPAPVAVVPASTPLAKKEVRQSTDRTDTEETHFLATESRKYERAGVDDKDEEGASGHVAADIDQVTTPEMTRTPKLSYATSSSAGSPPSTAEPRTDIRARILSMGTPTRTATASNNGDFHTTHELVFQGSYPSVGTSSSMSDANGPENAFDILLSSTGMDSIDGLPQSRVAKWARRDGSDDSEVTIGSVSSTEDGAPRDIFEEGKVSVW